MYVHPVSPSPLAVLQVRSCSGHRNGDLTQVVSWHGSENLMLMCIQIGLETGTCTWARSSNQITHRGLGRVGEAWGKSLQWYTSNQSPEVTIYPLHLVEARQQQDGIQLFVDKIKGVTTWKRKTLLYLSSVVPDNCYTSFPPDFSNDTSQNHFSIFLELSFWLLKLNESYVSEELGQLNRPVGKC